MPVAYTLGRLNVWEGAKDSIKKEAYVTDGPAGVEETAGGEGILLGRLDAHDSILFDTTVPQLSLKSRTEEGSAEADSQYQPLSPTHESTTHKAGSVGLHMCLGLDRLSDTLVLDYIRRRAYMEALS